MKTTQTDLDRRKFLKLSTRYATYAAASPIIIACSGGGGGASKPDTDAVGTSDWTLVPTASSDAAAAAEKIFPRALPDPPSYFFRKSKGSDGLCCNASMDAREPWRRSLGVTNCR